MSFGSPQARELAARESDGIHVLLLWHPNDNALTVSVEDARVGDRFQLAVAPDRALDDFAPHFGAHRRSTTSVGCFQCARTRKSRNLGLPRTY